MKTPTSPQSEKREVFQNRGLLRTLSDRLGALGASLGFHEGTGEAGMRDRILFAVLFLGVLLSCLAFVPSLLLAFRERVWGKAAIDVMGLICGIGLLIARGVGYQVRAWGASFLVYATGLQILFTFGFLSGGTVWLFASGVLCGLLLGVKAAFIGVAVNALTLLFLGWLHGATPVGEGLPFFASWAHALAFGGSFIFLNAMVALASSLMIQDEKETSLSLEKEKRQILDAHMRLEQEMDFRREAETRQRELSRELEFLHDTAMEFVGERDEETIYRTIARRMREIAGDVFVIVSHYEPNGKRFRTMAVEGLGANAERVLNTLGRNPVGMITKLNDDQAERALKTGKLTDGPEDLHELSFGAVPAAIGRAIERLLGIRRIHVIGLVHQGELFGSAIIIDRNTSADDRVTAKERLLEAYVNQAALALLRIRFERELKESEERYRQLVNNVPAGIYEVDLKDFRIISVNDVMCGYTGYTREELMALYPASLFSKESLNDYIERGRAAFAGQPITKSSEYKLVRKDGAPFWVRFQSRVEYAEGLPVKATVVVHDITELKSLEQERHRLRESLLEARKREAVATLAGGIAHQFNNALSVVTGCLDLIDQGPEQLDGKAKYLRMIRLSTERMTELTARLMAYAGVGSYYDRELLLGQFLTETLPSVLSSLPSEIEVETELQSEVPSVKMDPDQMTFVLSTTLTNASEAMGGAGRIRIRLRKEVIEEDDLKLHPDLTPGTYVSLIIQDHGKGMDEVTRRRLFDPFFSTKFQGRGLSMPAVLGIVEAHGGWIGVESTPGKGTTVRILLPALTEGQEGL